MNTSRDLMSCQLATKQRHTRIGAFPLRSSFLSARFNALLINTILISRSRIVFFLTREAVPLAIVGALLISITTLGWLVLRSVSDGTGKVDIRLNWTAIFALSVPLVALAFLLVWLFVRVAQWQKPHDTVS